MVIDCHYEKLVELDAPAMVHVSASCNPNFHATGAHYINADTTAFMQFLSADLFRDFPTLRFVIPHGGGAVPYHWGRYRGLAQEMKRPALVDLIRHNVFFDTCVYHYPGIELLLKIVPVGHTVTLGSKRVTLIHLGDAHAVDSVALHFPDERAVFSADILQVRRLPGGLAPTVGAWIDAVKTIFVASHEDTKTIWPRRPQRSQST